MNTEVILETQKLCKTFGATHALKNVDFLLKSGEIHCLVGENGSGKSTFVKTVSGVHIPDSGKILLNGHEYDRCTVRDSIREGIQVIYQDLSLFPHMSIAENIATNKLIVQNKRLIDWAEIKSIAQGQLERINVDMDLDASIESTSIANRQLVAICRALTMDARVLFMDEPTTALTSKEVDRLFSIVMELKKKGMAIVFISHKLNEVLEVADSVSIFRDGEKVGDFETDEINEKMLSFYMTGREVEYPHYKKGHTDTETVLQTEHLSSSGHFNDISITVERGDIVGITGLLGAGRTELALSLFGLNRPDSGKIIINNKEMIPQNCSQAIDEGIALLPENRQTQGCYMEKDITDNVCAGVLDKVKNHFGILKKKQMEDRANSAIQEFNIVAQGRETLLSGLSGGNQQKVLLSKWIAVKPELLILDSPTVGVDIGAKAEIYEQIQQHAAAGMSMILISDDIPELIANCNRLFVMKNGQIMAVLEDEEISAPDSHEKITKLMNG